MPNYRPALISAPDTYGESWTEIPIAPVGANYVCGHAKRVGVTAPGFPDHPTYQFVLAGGERPPEVYVWESGEFVEVHEWYKRQTFGKGASNHA